MTEICFREKRFCGLRGRLSHGCRMLDMACIVFAGTLTMRCAALRSTQNTRGNHIFIVVQVNLSIESATRGNGRPTRTQHCRRVVVEAPPFKMLRHSPAAMLTRHFNILYVTSCKARWGHHLHAATPTTLRKSCGYTLLIHIKSEKTRHYVHASRGRHVEDYLCATRTIEKGTRNASRTCLPRHLSCFFFAKIPDYSPVLV